MIEITWPEAIEKAKRRPLYVLFNGAKGDFESLKSTGIVGPVTQDDTGKWFVDTGAARVYPSDNDTVWVG